MSLATRRGSGRRTTACWALTESSGRTTSSSPTTAAFQHMHVYWSSKPSRSQQLKLNEASYETGACWAHISSLGWQISFFVHWSFSQEPTWDGRWAQKWRLLKVDGARQEVHAVQTQDPHRTPSRMPACQEHPGVGVAVFNSLWKLKKGPARTASSSLKWATGLHATHKWLFQWLYSYSTCSALIIFVKFLIWTNIYPIRAPLMSTRFFEIE